MIDVKEECLTRCLQFWRRPSEFSRRDHVMYVVPHDLCAPMEVRSEYEVALVQIGGYNRRFRDLKSTSQKKQVWQGMVEPLPGRSRR